MRMFGRVLILFALLCQSSAFADPGEVISSLAAPGKNSTGLAFDGKFLWVADHRTDTLTAVDPKTGAVRARYPSPGYRPADLAFDGQQLWCVDVAQARLFRIQTSDGLTTRVIPAPVAVPRALAWDGSALWVSDDKTRSLHRVDPEDGTTIREFAFPGHSVDGLAHDGTYLWVADRLADKLYALETDGGEVVVTLDAPGPHPTGLAFDGQNLAVVDYQTDAIASLRRDDASHLLRSNPREAWVVLLEQVRNFGPDPLPKLELLVAIPSARKSQEILAGPFFSPETFQTLNDRWDQKVARFEFENLVAGQAGSVEMTVKVKAWDVRHVIYPDRVEGLWKIPTAVRRRYLVDAPKYDLHNPVIQKAVADAVGKEKSPYWIARKIYAHIHEKMHYELVGGWDVAPKVLARGSGSCSEYSFVFISMCRAAGLPARYVGALVVRKDDASYDDVFHRWAEVYLPPYGWVPVDPSRGDKPTQAGRADAFGHLTPDFLITTEGGGDSKLLQWYYNSNHRYTCQGRCRVEAESIAEWSPEDPRGAVAPADSGKKAAVKPSGGANATCGEP